MKGQRITVHGDEHVRIRIRYNDESPEAVAADLSRAARVCRTLAETLEDMIITGEEPGDMTIVTVPEGE